MSAPRYSLTEDGAARPSAEWTADLIRTELADRLGALESAVHVDALVETGGGLVVEVSIRMAEAIGYDAPVSARTTDTAQEGIDA